jgi:hypothetical protein
MQFVIFFFFLFPAVLHSEQISGVVLDATTKEPIGRALVRDLISAKQTETDDKGRFSLGERSASQVSLQITCVGYRPLRLTANPAQSRDLEIALIPDTLRHSETLQVAAGPYALESPNSVSLAGAELRNLASVLADDPLRAIQGLPGINTGDDFQSQISLRGAGFQRIGVYLDGVLLHSPFHTLQADPTSASLSILSSDLLEHAELFSGAPPARFADRTAGAIDVRLRDGDRKKFTGRAAASASNASMSLEAPFAAGRGSWLVSARKSYLQYIIEASSDEPGLAFGFSDMQGRLAYGLTPRHSVSLSLINGRSGLDRSGAESMVGLNTFFESGYAFTLAKIGSRSSPASTLVLNHTAAWLRERYENRNRERNPLAFGHYGEWIANSDNIWQFHENASLVFGGTLRRIRDDGFLDRRLAAPPFSARLDQYRGNGIRGGVHSGPQFSLWQGRLQLRAGGRADYHSVNETTAWSPSAAATWVVRPGSQFNAAWGSYAQYPELNQFYSRFGNIRLLPERANHVQAGWEQRWGERTRIRFEAYHRADRDLLFRPLFEARILGGRIYGGSNTAPILNSVRGDSRGMQIFVQRRSSNGVTGWVSYAYSVSKLRDGTLGLRFPSDFDQRHTANVFLSYRWKPDVNFSGRWLAGSGFPVRGFVRGTNPQFFLSGQRNQLRLPTYHRMDFRANKTFLRRGWHITLYAEVVNLYGRDNVRFDEMRGFDARTGAARLGFDKLFPVLPSAGVSMEF